MGRWNIEGLEGPALCFPKAKQLSQRVAQAQSRPVLVRYIGRRDNPNTKHEESDFLQFPDGQRDFKVDPTWHENKP